MGVMVLARDTQRSETPYRTYAGAHLPDFDDDVWEGIQAVVTCRNNGYISEEQADDLTKVLVAGYIGMLISRQVSDYLDDALAQVLQHQIEGWNTVGERR